MQSTRAAAEPPPETTTLRLLKNRALCRAPQYLADELLRAEGFANVQYLEFPEAPDAFAGRLSAGAIDLMQWEVTPFIEEIDRNSPVVFLAGVHPGCWELIASQRIRRVRDLMGKTIAVPYSSQKGFLVAMLSHAGLDYRQDVRLVESSPADVLRRLAAGEIDAFVAVPPITLEARALNIGHVVLNTTTDRPWSDYLCCMLVANRGFIRTNPIATKRALRALLKADHICAVEPERAARALVERGVTRSYDYALQAMREIPYGRWRHYDPNDTVRFYAQRLHDVGVIQSTPTKIVAQGTDWRFLNELKRELKG